VKKKVREFYGKDFQEKFVNESGLIMPGSTKLETKTMSCW